MMRVLCSKFQFVLRSGIIIHIEFGGEITNTRLHIKCQVVLRAIEGEIVIVEYECGIGE